MQSTAAAPRLIRPLHHAETALMVFAFLGAISLPLLEAFGRPFHFSLKGSSEYLRYLVLWLTFLGGMVAARERQHLQLSTGEALPGVLRRPGRILAGGLAAGIAAALSYASVDMILRLREATPDDALPIGIPLWAAETIIPVALGVMALRFIWRADDRWLGRVVAVAIALLPFLLGHYSDIVEGYPWWLFAALVGAGVLGAPVFIVVGGMALLFYVSSGETAVAVPNEMRRLISSPVLPAVPLLTAAGYILAETHAADRLVRFFEAFFAWMPGGMAIMAAGVCGIFTTLTGGSGVTIIALGGLVYGMLKSEKYPDGFAMGHITASSSLGLLFPPCVPVVLYAVAISTDPDTSVTAEQLYLAGFIPGMLMVVMVAAYGAWKGRKYAPARPKFDGRELLAAAWGAKWELSVPLVVIGLFVSAFVSTVEAAATAALYALIIEVFITRDLHPVRDLPRVLAKAGAMVGAVLMLLAVATALNQYALVEAELPDMLLEWTTTHVESQWVFLLALNVLLIILGSVLEVFSALIILPPLLAPLARHFEVDPIHLGIIFLANLELGFLTPPVGLNLFLAATRFQQPMLKLYRHIFPYVAIMAASVLIITYVPAISAGVAHLFDKEKVDVAHHLAQPEVQEVAGGPGAAARQGADADGAAVPRRPAEPERASDGAQPPVDGAPRADAPAGGGVQGVEPG
ncbi:MAG: TRAP transporter large permease subunit [Myxococcales bacterium]|nr:TRAP transporter large permease subunit [Myxococcales bacterium]